MEIFGDVVDAIFGNADNIIGGTAVKKPQVLLVDSIRNLVYLLMQCNAIN